MSTHSLHTPPDTDLGAPESTHGHGSRRAYRIGVALSILLTVVPFWLVMSKALPNPTVMAAVIFALALIQITVHVVSFLHLDTRSEGGWTLLAFLFTAVIVVLTIGGSVLGDVSPQREHDADAGRRHGADALTATGPNTGEPFRSTVPGADVINERFAIRITR